MTTIRTRPDRTLLILMWASVAVFGVVALIHPDAVTALIAWMGTHVVGPVKEFLETTIRTVWSTRPW